MFVPCSSISTGEISQLKCLHQLLKEESPYSSLLVTLIPWWTSAILVIALPRIHPILLSVIMEEVSLSLSYFFPVTLSPSPAPIFAVFSKRWMCQLPLSQSIFSELPGQKILCTPEGRKETFWDVVTASLTRHVLYKNGTSIKISALIDLILRQFRTKKSYSLPSSSASAFRDCYRFPSFVFVPVQNFTISFFCFVFHDFMITPLFYSSSNYYHMVLSYNDDINDCWHSIISKNSHKYSFYKPISYLRHWQ